VAPILVVAIQGGGASSTATAVVVAAVVVETTKANDNFMMPLFCLRVCKYKEKEIYRRERNKVSTQITSE
jgi:hypothetical protein